MSLVHELLWFLPWCWGVNMSLNLLGFLTTHLSFLACIDRPIDGGRRFFDGRRLFGDARTWNGLLLAALLGAVFAFSFPGHGFFRLAVLVWVGDALGSFVKRRLDVPRGRFLPFVDHGDYVIVAGAYALLAGYVSLTGYLTAYITTLVLTPFVTRLAYALHVRNAKL